MLELFAKMSRLVENKGRESAELGYRVRNRPNRDLPMGINKEIESKEMNHHHSVSTIVTLHNAASVAQLQSPSGPNSIGEPTQQERSMKSSVVVQAPTGHVSQAASGPLSQAASKIQSRELNSID